MPAAAMPGAAIHCKVTMKLITAKIQGCTPLLQQRFCESAELPGATRAMLVNHGTPREEAEKVTYRDSQGRFYFPGTAIGRLLREAAANHKMKGSRRSARFVVPAAVLVMTDAVFLLNGNGELAVDFETDSRPVVIPATRGRIMKHRPRFDKWSASFVIRINETLLPVDFVHRLLTEGGQQIGIGDFRPEKGGPFGTFNVVEWKEC